MSKKLMNVKSAARIQSKEALKNHGIVSRGSFASRAQRAAEKNLKDAAKRD